MGRFVRASCQNPLPVRTKLGAQDCALVRKRAVHIARGWVRAPRGSIRRGCEELLAVRTELNRRDPVAVSERGCYRTGIQVPDLGGITVRGGGLGTIGAEISATNRDHDMLGRWSNLSAGLNIPNPGSVVVVNGEKLRPVSTEPEELDAVRVPDFVRYEL